MKRRYDDIVLPTFYALAVQTGCWGRHVERKISFYISRPPSSQGRGSLQIFKEKHGLDGKGVKTQKAVFGGCIKLLN